MGKQDKNTALRELLDEAEISNTGLALEQAAACGRDALRSAAPLSSTLVTDRLRLLQRQVTPPRAASPYLADLDDRITEHLLRSARDHRTNTTL